MKCPKTGKTTFSKKGAATFINSHKNDGMRSYPCGHCKGWHITSKMHYGSKVERLDPIPRGWESKEIQHEDDFKRFLDTSA